MDKFKSHKENKIEETVDKHALILALYLYFYVE
jgi:DHA1 family tetracycline resistance protein-like MFS transporter